uniref:Uncharacterized protein n=1 Tax=Vespula pensylvanica TaxID=30213 RepID=A0A834N8D6_VESPE|nr:hypothetical protein H0235_015744 [Vespula pensylvanica]
MLGARVGEEEDTRLWRKVIDAEGGGSTGAGAGAGAGVAAAAATAAAAAEAAAAAAATASTSSSKVIWSVRRDTKRTTTKMTTKTTMMIRRRKWVEVGSWTKIKMRKIFVKTR